MRTWLLLFALLGCDTPDFAQEWELDRLRLLAVRADPAEPRPGEHVRFTSLVHAPEAADWSAVWIACVEGDAEGCTLDPDLLARLEHADTLSQAELLALYAELQAAGFVGVEPGMTLGWTVPEDALDGLDDAALAEGRTATVTVTLATADEQELTLKSIPVSLAATPNHNPDLGALTIDGNAVAVGAIVVVDPSSEYSVEVELAEAPEAYQYVTSEGVTEERTESPSYRWYTSGGTLAESDTGLGGFGEGEPETSSARTWVSPAEAGTYLLHAVVLDGRGGMGWQSATLSVR